MKQGQRFRPSPAPAWPCWELWRVGAASVSRWEQEAVQLGSYASQPFPGGRGGREGFGKKRVSPISQGTQPYQPVCKGLKSTVRAPLTSETRGAWNGLTVSWLPPPCCSPAYGPPAKRPSLSRGPGTEAADARVVGFRAPPALRMIQASPSCTPVGARSHPNALSL